MSETQWDVIVVGSGAAGLCAALEAHDSGRSVLVLESETEPGGSSRISGGMILAAGTPLQRRHGVEDAPEAFHHDYLMHTQWKVQHSAAHHIAHESAAAIAWLEERGVDFYDYIFDAGYDGVPRTHSAVGRGGGIIAALLDQVVARGIEVRCDHRVGRLLVDDGTVIGVETEHGRLHGAAVVLATGGFGANPELLREHVPAIRGAGDEMWYIGNESSRGDIFGLLSELRVPITGHGRAVIMMSPGFSSEAFEGYLPGWMLLVNGEGRRFCDESLPYGTMDGLVREQGDQAWIVFDEASISAVAPGDPAEYRLQIPSLPDRPSPNWNRDVVATQHAAGRVARADTIEELAEQIGLPSDALAASVRRYNSGAEAGRDLDYGKAPTFLRELSGPFYGAQMKLNTVCLTSVGPAIDTQARVIGADGEPVPGLYAAGECTGGTLGDRYVGTGNSWINCVVYGRTAGQAAAAA